MLIIFDHGYYEVYKEEGKEVMSRKVFGFFGIQPANEHIIIIGGTSSENHPFLSTVCYRCIHTKDERQAIRI
jgi:hypothetical protein